MHGTGAGYWLMHSLPGNIPVCIHPLEVRFRHELLAISVFDSDWWLVRKASINCTSWCSRLSSVWMSARKVVECIWTLYVQCVELHMCLRQWQHCSSAIFVLCIGRVYLARTHWHHAEKGVPCLFLSMHPRNVGSHCGCIRLIILHIFYVCWKITCCAYFLGVLTVLKNSSTQQHLNLWS